MAPVGSSFSCVCWADIPGPDSSACSGVVPSRPSSRTTRTRRRPSTGMVSCPRTRTAGRTTRSSPARRARSPSPRTSRPPPSEQSPASARGHGPAGAPRPRRMSDPRRRERTHAGDPSSGDSVPSAAEAPSPSAEVLAALPHGYGVECTSPSSSRTCGSPRTANCWPQLQLRGGELLGRTVVTNGVVGAVHTTDRRVLRLRLLNGSLGPLVRYSCTIPALRAPSSDPTGACSRSPSRSNRSACRRRSAPRCSSRSLTRR